MTAGSWSDWLGREQRLEDEVTPKPVAAMAATIGPAEQGVAPGEAIPPLWHWLYFLPIVPMDQIGADGHPKRGGFLPPIPLDRRMWAGGALRFQDEIRIGDRLTKISRIDAVTEKEGRAGAMVFVTVSHTIETARGPAVTERQDIVYLPMPERYTAPKAVPGPEQPLWQDDVLIDSVRLFRFSALTFNGHRIHYDLPYARDVEKYPGLVVHGPMQAMLLMGAALAHHPDKRPDGFKFRGIHPLFDFDRPRIVAQAAEGGVHLATLNSDGTQCQQATLTWRED